MKDIDERIRDALLDEDARYLEGVETELPMHLRVIEVFRGRSRWLVLVAVIVGLVFMALAVVACLRFAEAESVRDMLAWCLGFMFCMAAVLGMKIWFWMELNRNAVTREVKRVELQLAQISARLAELQKASNA